MYHKQTGADSTDLSFSYSQCLVARNPCILTDSPYCGRQVSRLIDQTRHASLPGLPVVLWRALSNHGDEIVRDLHPLPFSPGPARLDPRLPDTFRIIYIYASYHNPGDQTMSTGNRHEFTVPTKSLLSHPFPPDRSCRLRPRSEPGSPIGNYRSPESPNAQGHTELSVSSQDPPSSTL
mgnify:CR=1 FL=1